MGRARVLFTAAWFLDGEFGTGDIEGPVGEGRMRWWCLYTICTEGGVGSRGRWARCGLEVGWL